MDFCAECGKELKITHGTARVACCGGLAYWSEVTPLMGIRTVKYGKYNLYVNRVEWQRQGKARVNTLNRRYHEQ